MTNGEKFLQVYGGLPLVYHDEEEDLTAIYQPGKWWDEEYIDPEEIEVSDE